MLVAHGDLADTTLIDGLTTLGYLPHAVVVYRNLPAEPLPPDLVDDLASGAVRVTSQGPLDPAEVRAAVDEAGFDLTEPEG